MQANPLNRALDSLEGLSVGDAFGERFFVNPDVVGGLIHQRALASEPWPYTDDTEMALSVFSVLRECGRIDQDRLALSFARRYNPSRGYGPTMHGLLQWIRLEMKWDVLATGLFGGQGSYGNGAAMRVAPVGAFFAEDLEAAVGEAERSAVVTHAHPEGVAGAIAVAVAAAIAARAREQGGVTAGAEFIDRVRDHVPDSEVRERLRHARNLLPGCSVELAVAALGNGIRISAQDTVPFCVWCASRSLDNYDEALWETVSGLGDRDTTCAIVGGIVAAFTGIEGIPAEWRRRREPLPEWPFSDATEGR